MRPAGRAAAGPKPAESAVALRSRDQPAAVGPGPNATRRASEGREGEEKFKRAMGEPLHLAAAKRSFEAPHFIVLLLAMEEPSENPQGLGVRQADRKSVAPGKRVDLG